MASVMKILLRLLLPIKLENCIRKKFKLTTVLSPAIRQPRSLSISNLTTSLHWDTRKEIYCQRDNYCEGGRNRKEIFIPCIEYITFNACLCVNGPFQLPRTMDGNRFFKKMFIQLVAHVTFLSFFSNTMRSNGGH